MAISYAIKFPFYDRFVVDLSRTVSLQSNCRIEFLYAFGKQQLPNRLAINKVSIS